MRIRSIKPEFWKSEDISELSWETRFIFIGLWSYVEDEGAGRDNIRLITAELFPLEPDLTEAAERVEKAMAELESRGRIVRYVGCSIRHGTKQDDPKRLFYVTNWSRHQVVRNPNKPRFTTPTSEDGVYAESTQSLCTGTEVQRDRGTEELEGETRASGARRHTPPHTLPDDWSPNQKHRDKANELGVDVESIAEDMRRWAFAKDVTRANWNSQFNGFLARAKPKSPNVSIRRTAEDIDWDKL